MSDKNTAAKVGGGLAAGAAIGMALGLFLQSRKGKELTKDAMKKAATLQKQVVKKLMSAEKITKEKYEEVVDQALKYYEKSKELAAKEIPAVRKQLMGEWKKIEKHLKNK